jgi:hypothetical protein
VLTLSVHSGYEDPHVYRVMTLNEVDCQKASMLGAHSCGDLVYNHTPEGSPTAILAKHAYYHHHPFVYREVRDRTPVGS